ncbi:cupin domain-containing protein [Phormidesmis sp. 146-35]
MEPENPCIDEMIAARSLDSLDEDDRRLVDQAITQSPELAAELADFQAVVAALAYSAPSPAIAPNLKERLFDKIRVADSARPLPGDRFVRAEDQVWQPHPFVPRVTIAILHRDRTDRKLTCLLRAEAGVTYPTHRHASVEEIYMLEGDLEVAGQVYYGGDYIRSSQGSSHAPHTQGGCMFLIKTSLDDEYFN